MSFEDPYDVQNPAEGDDILTAYGDVIRQDLMALYGRPVVRVHRSTSGSVPNNTLTSVTFDVEDIDTHAMHDNVSNADRLTVPAGWNGSWLVGATVQWQTNTTGVRRHAQITSNGTGKLVDVESPPDTATGYSTCNLLTVANAIAGEFFTLKVFQDSGGNLNVNPAAVDDYAGTIFWAHFIGSGAG